GPYADGVEVGPSLSTLDVSSAQAVADGRHRQLVCPAAEQVLPCRPELGGRGGIRIEDLPCPPDQEQWLGRLLEQGAVALLRDDQTGPKLSLFFVLGRQHVDQARVLEGVGHVRSGLEKETVGHFGGAVGSPAESDEATQLVVDAQPD